MKEHQYTGFDVDAMLEHIISLARQHTDIVVLWLYGSRAKGTAQVNSDYDFAVAFYRFPDDAWEKQLRPELLAQSWQEQLELDEKRVSVVDINNIPLPLAMNIITTGKVLLVKDSLRLSREEHRISAMWELDYEHHRKVYG